jgi:hypothetical protein
MRKKLELTCVASLVLTVVVGTLPAFAATIRQPAARPFTVAEDRSGSPQPFTIVASGFRPGSLAYVEQCDGASLTAPDWSPTLHCDIGTAPAPVIVARDGTATFRASDRNHGFHPVRGESPQSVFNCLASGDAPPHNGLASYSTCRVRVSSNNAAPTDNQAFLDIRISNAAAVVPATIGGGSSSQSPTQDGAGTATASGSHNGSTGAASSDVSAGARAAPSDPPTSGSNPSSGRLAFTGGVILGFIVLAGALIAIGTVLRRARVRRAASR